MALVDQLRQIGLPMGSCHVGQHISWTTDAGKAEAAESLGAQIERYVSYDFGGAVNEKFSGWTITCPIERPTLVVVEPWEGAE